MTNIDGELIHEELEEWNPEESDAEMDIDDEDAESDEMDYE